MSSKINIEFNLFDFRLFVTGLSLIYMAGWLFGYVKVSFWHALFMAVAVPVLLQLVLFLVSAFLAFIIAFWASQ